MFPASPHIWLTVGWICLVKDIGLQKALELLNKSKEALSKDTAQSLILADQALEYFLRDCCAFLGTTENTVIISRDGKQKEFNRWGFTEYMTFLDDHKFLTQEEKSNFFMFHNWRNSVQHIGLEPSRKQVELVISSVDGFMVTQIEARKQAHILPPILRRFTQAIKELDPDSKIAQIDEGINNQVTYSKDILQHRKISKLTPEELIRAYLVTSLISRKHYPINCIELEKSYKIGRKEKETEARVDVLVKKDNLPFMLIEVKRQERYEPELSAQIETQLYAPAHLEDPLGKNMRYLVYYTADATEQVGITERTNCIDFQHYQTFEQWEKDGQPNLLSIPIEYGIVRKPVFIKDGKHGIQVNVSRKELEGLRLEYPQHSLWWWKISNRVIFQSSRYFVS